MGSACCWLRARRMAACGMNHSMWPGLCCCVHVTVALVVGVSDVVATICTASLKIHFMFTPLSRRSR